MLIHHVSVFQWVISFSAIFRFGSIISGAIQSKFSAKKDTSGQMDSSAKKKQKRGSFSFLGGMQVGLYTIVFIFLGNETFDLQSTYSCVQN